MEHRAVLLLCRHEILSVETLVSTGGHHQQQSYPFGARTKNSSPRERLIWGPRHCQVGQGDPLEGQLRTDVVSVGNSNASSLSISTQLPGSLPLPEVPRPAAHHNLISSLTADSEQLSLGHHMAHCLSSLFSRCLPGAMQGPVAALKGLSWRLDHSFKKNNCLYLLLATWGLHCRAQAFSSYGERGLLSSCSVQASRCNDFSCCGAQAPGYVVFRSCCMT